MSANVISLLSFVTPARHLCGVAGIAALVAALTAAPVAAQSWNTTTGNWNTAASWSPASVPVSGTATQIILGSTQNFTATNNIPGVFTLNRLTFDRPNQATLNPGTANNSSLLFDGTAPAIVTDGTAYTGGRTNTINSSVQFNQDTTISSILSDAVTGAGNGTLTFGATTPNNPNPTFNATGKTITITGPNAAPLRTFTVNINQAITNDVNFLVKGATGGTTAGSNGGALVVNVNAASAFSGTSANVTLQGGDAGTVGNGGTARFAWTGSNATFAPVVTFLVGGTGSSSSLSAGTNSAVVRGISSVQNNTFTVSNNGATNPGTLTIDNTANFSYGGRIVNGGTGVLNLVKSGAGEQIFTGSATVNSLTYTGTTTVNAGTLTFNTNVNNALTSAITVNGGTLNLGASAGTLTASGGVTNAGGIVNILTGATVTGLTQSMGTTTVNGTVTGTVNVTGGTVQGTGTLPAFALNSGTILAPGNSIGTINAAGLTFNGGGTIAFELDQLAGTSDLVDLTGLLTKGSAGAYTFDFGATSLTAVNTFTLAEFASTDFVASDFSLTGLTGSGFNFDLVVNPTSIQLVASAAAVVPESGTGLLALLGIGVSVLIPVVRRRAG